MVLGIALPGMQESLNISSKTVNLPNKVEISMETSKFEQNNIITFVTPKIFDESISFDKLNEFPLPAILLPAKFLNLQIFLS